MKMLRASRVLLSVLGLLALVGAQPASALESYGNLFGANFSFTGIQAQTGSGDTEPLWGSPALGPDLITFSPTTFSASAAGDGGFDYTNSTLELIITATDTDTIDFFYIDEVGTNAFNDPGDVGTDATGTWAALSGYLTITHALVANVNTDITDVVIGFNAGDGTNGSFSPAALGVGGLALPGDLAVTAWTGNIAIDVGSYIANATRAELILNNEVDAYSETGTDATLSKTSVVIKVVPEPGTFVLVAGGLLAMTLFGARSRRN
jgi:hypothetical protein